MNLTTEIDSFLAMELLNNEHITRLDTSYCFTKINAFSTFIERQSKERPPTSLDQLIKSLNLLHWK